MNAITNPNSRLFAAFLAVLMLFAGSARAANIVAWSYDPTQTQVYFQLSTDEPLDAVRAIVVKMRGGIAGVNVQHLPGAMGASGVVNGLTPNTRYKLIIQIKWFHGDTWHKAKRQRFRTNP